MCGMSFSSNFSTDLIHILHESENISGYMDIIIIIDGNKMRMYTMW